MSARLDIDDKLKETLIEQKGYLGITAHILECSVMTVQRHIAASKELQDLLHQIRTKRTDFVESKLMQKISEGDTACIIFYLKTQARGRGYNERLEIADVTAKTEIAQSPKEIELLRELMNEYKKRNISVADGISSN